MTLPGPVPVPVVFDVNVLVLAAAVGESPFRSWPSPPPASGNPSADCLGVINDAAEFALWLSPHILVNTGRVLAAVLKTPDDEVDEYLQVLTDMSEASGGGLTDPPQTVGDCSDWEDNRVLDLAAAVGAFLIVSADSDLTTMSPWRGRPVIEPSQFASLIDASRRARRPRR
jgi:predicted nucleic acid-binding protein